MTTTWRRIYPFLKLVLRPLDVYELDFLEARGYEYGVSHGMWTAEDTAVAVYIAELERACIRTR